MHQTKSLNLIFSVVALVCDDILDAARHRIGKGFAQILVNFFTPNVFNNFFQFFQASWIRLRDFLLKITVHKFSIGFKSGEFPGHRSTLTFLA